jgi:hypothetical protein
MKYNLIKLAKILTYCGTLPLIGSLLFIQFALSGIDIKIVASAYSAIIISFLCGIHWAVYLFFTEKCPTNLLLSSNAIALLAWTSLLLEPLLVSKLLQVLCFIYLLSLDLKLRVAGVLPEWFFMLRRNATIIVVLCLLTMLFVS